jgi:hypothetical protein
VSLKLKRLSVDMFTGAINLEFSGGFERGHAVLSGLMPMEMEPHLSAVELQQAATQNVRRLLQDALAVLEAA